MRLRDYVAEIDQFLDRSQPGPAVGLEMVQDDIAHAADTGVEMPTSYDDGDMDISETVIPLEYLQRIPWPGDWLDSLDFF